MEGLGKRVMIVGGTGLLGYHAGLEFLKRGYGVTALAIKDIDLDEWFPKEIPVIYADVFKLDVEALENLMRCYDTLIYAMGPDDRSVPSAPASGFFHEKLVQTSARVFEAAARAGIKRGVLLGSYFHHFHRKWPHLRLAGRHPYIKARVDQEEAVLEAVMSVPGPKMETMILELPYIFGTMPNRIPLWKEVFFDRLLHMNPIFFPSGGSSMICVENVAEAIAGAVAHGEHGIRYPIGGQNIQWKEMFAIMFRAIGVKRRIIHVPYWVAAVAGRYMMWKEKQQSREPGIHLAFVFKDIIGRKYFLEPANSALALRYGIGDVRASIARTAVACYPQGYTK
ncbi:MAG: NAD-dependent epimerase/dehydratase family protein [Bacteroidota bacterium]